MQSDEKLVIVGGAGRNVGKTECVCRLIAKTAVSLPVFGLKVSAIYPDETMFHGDHGAAGLVKDIFEEHIRDSSKDTSRMLRAGAERVFFLCCENQDVYDEYQRFRAMVGDERVVICESNSLSDYVKPALHIVVVPREGEIKPRAVKKIAEADLVLFSRGVGGFDELARVSYYPNRGWCLAHAEPPLP